MSDQKAWAKEHVKGLETILMASFTPDLSGLDEDGIRHDVRQSKAHGVFSVFCEMAGIAPDEQRRFLEVVADEAAGDLAVGLPVMAPTVEGSIALLEKAEAAGATHALVHPPFHRSFDSADAVRDYYRTVIDATDLPVVLWATDGHQFKAVHPSNVPYEVFDELADLPNVVALKLMTTLDPTAVFRLCELTADRLLVAGVQLGSLPMLARNYGMQWSGAWTIEALQSPEKPYAVDYLDQLNAGDFDAAFESYWKMAPAYGMLFQLMAPMLPKGIHPFTHLKYYQWCVGGNGGLLREPEHPNEADFPLTADDREHIKNGFRAIGIEPTTDPDDVFVVGRAAAAAGVTPDDWPTKWVYEA